MNSSQEKAIAIVYQLREKGYKAYLCGGCVRDFLLQRTPKDYDIVSDATIEQVQKIFRYTILVGAQFGVIKVIYDSEIFEIATFRKDGQYQDGRRPDSVIFGDEEQDALRRDFTINGLFYDPTTDKIIDYVQGQEDLAKKVIRTIGNPDERFSEDYLRLMRAIRFACQLDFAIEQQTWDALIKFSSYIIKVSSERIRDELIAMMLSPHPKRAVQLLDQTGILKIIFPELYNDENTYIYIKEISNILETAKILPNFEIALIVLLHPLQKYRIVNKVKFEDIGKRLCLPKKSIDIIILLFEYYPKFSEVFTMSQSQLKRFLRISNFRELLDVYFWQCIATQSSLAVYEFCKQKLQEFSESDLHPKILCTGNDLIRLGFKPGPIFHTILLELEEQQLDGNIFNYEQAMEWIRFKFGRG